jgi:hypothetical protein
LCLNSVAGGLAVWYTETAPNFHYTLQLPYSGWIRWEEETNHQCTQSCSGRGGVWSTMLSNDKGILQLQLTADGLPSPTRKPNIYWYLGPHIRKHTVNGWIKRWQQQLWHKESYQMMCWWNVSWQVLRFLYKHVARSLGL